MNTTFMHMLALQQLLLATSNAESFVITFSTSQQPSLGTHHHNPHSLF
jgi:hypothetical protein